MTDADLIRIEALLRNPPSNGMLAELGLELLAELRLARSPSPGRRRSTVDPIEHQAVVLGATLDAESLGDALASHAEHLAGVLASHERPTPPMGVAVEPHEKKKGKR